MKEGGKVILSLCQHTVLTPAQREFVHAVAASHSAAHARRLITQHYLNVLHSCVQTGESGERRGGEGESAFKYADCV